MNKILVTIPHRGIGDLIYILPLLKSLNKTFGVKIDILSNLTNKAKYVYHNEDFVNSIQEFELDHKNLIFNLNKKFEYLKKINSYKTNLLIVTGRHSSLILPFHLSNAKNKKMFDLSFFNFRDPKTKNLLSCEKIYCNTKNLRLKNFIENFNLKVKEKKIFRKQIFFNIDSHHGQNNWPVKNFINIVNKIKYNFDKIFINFSPNNISFLKELPKNILKDNHITLTYKLKFNKILEILQNCQIVVGNESGLICLGLSYGKKVISIYNEQHTQPESSIINGNIKYFNSTKNADEDIIKGILGNLN
jgi:ADP-heptose:LPS heptosyltransferase|tara:strand:+ start:534 stop:1442 length:909 start_codon:yes stop_codon:yes gene_type:complete